MIENHQIHLLILPSWYPQNPNDIGGSFFREQALALHKKGFQVGVIIPQIRSIKDIKGLLTKPYGLNIQQDQGLNTFRWHAVNFLPKMPTLSQKRWLSLGMKLFETYIQQHGMPDIIHAHSLLNGGILAYEIQKKYGIPYLVTEHSTAFARDLIPKTTISNLEVVVRDAKYCLAVSKEFSVLLDTIFQTKKWKYLPNIVRDNFLKSALLQPENNDFTFINVCLLDKKKRIDLLLKAFAIASSNNPSLNLKIGGDGPERSSLESLAEQLQIKDKVTFLGMLSREEVLQAMQTSDAFVLSSEFETFGVVLIEALALGKPVVATKCGGPESIVTPEVGYLVENGSIDQLASAMMNLYNNRSLFNAETIRKYCEMQFSENAVTGKLAELYHQIINEQAYDSK